MYSHAFDTATFNHALMSPVHNFSLVEIYSAELHYEILVYTSRRVLPSLFLTRHKLGHKPQRVVLYIVYVIAFFVPREG